MSVSDSFYEQEFMPKIYDAKLGREYTMRIRDKYGPEVTLEAVTGSKMYRPFEFGEDSKSIKYPDTPLGVTIHMDIKSSLMYKQKTIFNRNLNAERPSVLFHLAFPVEQDPNDCTTLKPNPKHYPDGNDVIGEFLTDFPLNEDVRAIRSIGGTKVMRVGTYVTLAYFASYLMAATESTSIHESCKKIWDPEYKRPRLATNTFLSSDFMVQLLDDYCHLGIDQQNKNCKCMMKIRDLDDKYHFLHDFCKNHFKEYPVEEDTSILDIDIPEKINMNLPIGLDSIRSARVKGILQKRFGISTTGYYFQSTFLHLFSGMGVNAYGHSDTPVHFEWLVDIFKNAYLEPTLALSPGPFDVHTQWPLRPITPSRMNGYIVRNIPNFLECTLELYTGFGYDWYLTQTIRGYPKDIEQFIGIATLESNQQIPSMDTQTAQVDDGMDSAGYKERPTPFCGEDKTACRYPTALHPRTRLGLWEVCSPKYRVKYGREYTGVFDRNKLMLTDMVKAPPDHQGRFKQYYQQTENLGLCMSFSHVMTVTHVRANQKVRVKNGVPCVVSKDD